ncbi:MAG: hypothetical protein K0Q64_1866 [Nitrobacter vulgaris]|nr:hypothetical protein [Nitrobacter vulgaris]
MGSREETASDQNHRATLLTLSEAEGSKKSRAGKPLRKARLKRCAYRIVTGAGSGGTEVGWVPGKLAVCGGCGVGAALNPGAG